jgi:hypothetical protein
MYAMATGVGANKAIYDAAATGAEPEYEIATSVLASVGQATYEAATQQPSEATYALGSNNESVKVRIQSPAPNTATYAIADEETSTATYALGNDQGEYMENGSEASGRLNSSYGTAVQGRGSSLVVRGLTDADGEDEQPMDEYMDTGGGATLKKASVSRSTSYEGALNTVGIEENEQSRRESYPEPQQAERTTFKFAGEDIDVEEESMMKAMEGSQTLKRAMNGAEEDGMMKAMENSQTLKRAMNGGNGMKSFDFDAMMAGGSVRGREDRSSDPSITLAMEDDAVVDEEDGAARKRSASIDMLSKKTFLLEEGGSSLRMKSVHRGNPLFRDSVMPGAADDDEA